MSFDVQRWPGRHATACLPAAALDITQRVCRGGRPLPRLQVCVFPCHPLKGQEER